MDDEDSNREFYEYARQVRRAGRGRVVSRTCPTCKEPNALSRFEALKGYQCSRCADRDEGVC